MKRALILDRTGKDVITVNEDYDTINIKVAERFSKYGNTPAMEYQVTGKELLKDLHKFIGCVIQNNTAVTKLKEEIETLQAEQLKNIDGTPQFKDTHDKIELIRTKYLDIIKR